MEQKTPSVGRGNFWWYILWLVLALVVLWPILARGGNELKLDSDRYPSNQYPEALQFLSEIPALELGKCPLGAGFGRCTMLLDAAKGALYIVVRNEESRISRIWKSDGNGWQLIYWQLEASRKRFSVPPAPHARFFCLPISYFSDWEKNGEKILFSAAGRIRQCRR